MIDRDSNTRIFAESIRTFGKFASFAFHLFTAPDTPLAPQVLAAISAVILADVNGVNTFCLFARVNFVPVPIGVKLCLPLCFLCFYQPSL